MKTLKHLTIITLLLSLAGCANTYLKQKPQYVNMMNTKDYQVMEAITSVPQY